MKFSAVADELLKGDIIKRESEEFGKKLVNKKNDYGDSILELGTTDENNNVIAYGFLTADDIVAEDWYIIELNDEESNE